MKKNFKVLLLTDQEIESCNKFKFEHCAPTVLEYGTPVFNVNQDVN